MAAGYGGSSAAEELAMALSLHGGDNLLATPALVAGQTYAVVPTQFLRDFVNYGTRGYPYPGRINFTSLVNPHKPSVLKAGLREGVDYSIIPETIVYMLQERYFSTGNVIIRTAVAGPSGTVTIEAHPQLCLITSTVRPGVKVEVAIPRSTAASAILTAILTDMDSDAATKLGLKGLQRDQLRLFARDAQFDAEATAAAGSGRTTDAAASGAGVGGGAPRPPSVGASAAGGGAVAGGAVSRSPAAGTGAALSGAGVGARPASPVPSALSPTATPGAPVDPSGAHWRLVAGGTTLAHVARNASMTHIEVEVRKADGSWPRGLVFHPRYAPLLPPTDDDPTPAVSPGSTATGTTASPAATTAGGSDTKGDEGAAKVSAEARHDAALREEMVAWREGLTRGSVVDARDNDGKWLTAVVVSTRRTAESAASAAAGKLRTPSTGAAAIGTGAPRFLALRFRGFGPRRTRIVERDSDDVLPLYTRTVPWRQALRIGDLVEYAATEAASPGGEAEWMPAVVERLDFTALPQVATLEVLQPVGDTSPAMTVKLEVEDDWRLAQVGTHIDSGMLGAFARPASLPAPSVPSFADDDISGALAAMSISPVPAPTPSPTPSALAVRRTYLMRAFSGDGGGDDAGFNEADDDGGEEAAVGGAGDGETLTDEAAREAARARRYLAHYEARGSTAVTRSRLAAPGLAGLTNLGSTCYMSSVLQCLAHERQLRDYLVGNRYLSDVNRLLESGTKGEVVHSVAALFRAMWSGRYTIIAPQPVKEVISRVCTQFEGYHQHDSQEFAINLLDKLSDDLCRIKAAKKPYTEAPDHRPGTSAASQAQEEWLRHITRNDSQIVDLFDGLMRSHLTCNVCSCEGLTYEPFTTLSVPIPTSSWRSATVFYFGSTNERPMRMVYHYQVGIDRPTVTIRDLTLWIAEQLQLRAIAEAADADDRTGVARAAAAVGSAVTAAAGAAASTSASFMSALFGAPALTVPVSPTAAAGTPKAATTPRLPPPTPHEVVVAITTTDPCMIRHVLPHWASLELASRCIEKLQWMRAAPNFMVWHARGAAPGEAARSAAAPAARAASPAAGAAGAAAAAAATGLGDSAEWPIDYDEEDPDATNRAAARAGATAGGAGGGTGGIDVWGGYYGSAAATPAREIINKPRPATGPYGPRMADFAIVWVRRQSDSYRYGGSTVQFKSVADSLVVPIRARDDGSTTRLTNREFHEAIWRRMRRLLLGRHRTTFTPGGLPYTVGHIEYIYERRAGLYHDYHESALTATLPCDEAPFKHERTRQYVVQLPADISATIDSVEGGKSEDHESVAAPAPTGERITLDTCIRKFGTREQLEAGNGWRCPRCKDEVQAYKQMELFRLPPVLIVHFKRFKMELGGALYGGTVERKVEDLVEFPVRGLDMAPYLSMPPDSEGALYDLFAVSEHRGGTSGGHYVAHALHPDTGKWYLFDDTVVREASATSLVTREAYLLFYRRRTGAEAAAGAASTDEPASPAAAPGAAAAPAVGGAGASATRAGSSGATSTAAAAAAGSAGGGTARSGSGHA